MTIGIDKIGFATSNYVLKLNDLAKERGTDPEKLSKGLLLKELSIAPITEDIVTLGASAATEILTDEDKAAIDMVIVATESGIDQSKAAAIFIHGLLGINPFARSIEIKEACYGATAALDYAKLHVSSNPQSKVLVIASDIATLPPYKRYIHLFHFLLFDIMQYPPFYIIVQSDLLFDKEQSR